MPAAGTCARRVDAIGLGAIATVPLLFGSYLVVRTPQQAAALLAAILSVAALSWRRVRHRTAPDTTGADPLAALAFGGAVLLASALAWAYAYRLYTAHLSFSADVFRGAFSSVRGPIYGLPVGSFDGFAAIAVFTAAVFVAVVARCCAAPWATPGPMRSLMLTLLYLVLICAFACSESPRRLLEPVVHQARFFDAARAFSNAGELLRTYVSRISELPPLTRHYPPGMALLARAELSSGAHGAVKLAIIAATLSTPFLMSALVRELGRPDASLDAWVLTAASPAPLLFATTATTPLQMALAATGLLLLARAITRGSWAASLAVGLVVAAMTLLSASGLVFASSVGLVMATALAKGAVSWRGALRISTLACASFVAVFLALRAGFGFDVISCIQVARARASDLMRTTTGFDDPLRYLLRSSGNLVAFLIFLGLPLASMFLWGSVRAGSSARRTPPLASAFAVGAGITVLFAAFSGLYFLETERIWLFLLPGAVCAAAPLHRDLRELHGRRFALPVLSVSLLTCCLAELLFRHYL